MRQPPTVSVMMPVYNTARFLARAVEGILGQAFPDFELVVIDDGSTDGSPDILRRYADRDARVRLTCRANRGAVHTRNEILGQCRGRYLAVNDADDVSLPDRLARQVAFLDARPEVVCVGGHFDLIDAADRRLTTLRPPAENAAIQNLLLAGHCAVCHSAAMMRREAVDRAGGYLPEFTFSHDLDLWLRLGEVGAVANLPQTLIQFRLHEGSISETKRHEQRRLARLACERAWQRRGMTGCTFEAAEPWRPGRDRRSRHRYATRYGWWAFNSGERRTAMVYGAKAVAALPLNPAGWKLMACAAAKRTPVPAAEAVS